MPCRGAVTTPVNGAGASSAPAPAAAAALPRAKAGNGPAAAPAAAPLAAPRAAAPPAAPAQPKAAPSAFWKPAPPAATTAAAAPLAAGGALRQLQPPGPVRGTAPTDRTGRAATAPASAAAARPAPAPAQAPPLKRPKVSAAARPLGGANVGPGQQASRRHVLSSSSIAAGASTNATVSISNLPGKAAPAPLPLQLTAAPDTAPVLQVVDGGGKDAVRAAAAGSPGACGIHAGPTAVAAALVDGAAVKPEQGAGMTQCNAAASPRCGSPSPAAGKAASAAAGSSSGAGCNACAIQPPLELEVVAGPGWPGPPVQHEEQQAKRYAGMTGAAAVVPFGQVVPSRPRS